MKVITLARKPVPAVANIVREHGTGVLNVTACRIGIEVRFNPPASTNRVLTMGRPEHSGSGWREDHRGSEVAGRWPANLILVGEAVGDLDAQSGDVKGAVSNSKRAGTGFHGNWGTQEVVPSYSDSGGASRFFKRL